MHRFAPALLLLTALPSAFAGGLDTEYYSDHFVVLAEALGGAPLIATLDFNRGTSDIPGRERVAEFVGQACHQGRWFDLQSGEYPWPGQDMQRLVGNGVARVHRDRDGAGWVLDYDGARASFRVETEEEVLLHVQRDDPEMTIRHSAATATLEFGGRTFPATLFREQLRWRGYNRLVGRTPPRMYGHFDWMPLVSRRGDWWLLIQDPGQAEVPDDAPDHNWGVYRSPEGIIRPIPSTSMQIRPVDPLIDGHRRLTPQGWTIQLPDLEMSGWVHDRGHFLDRFASGLFAVVGEMNIPGAGRRTVMGLVDHIEH